MVMSYKVSHHTNNDVAVEGKYEGPVEEDDEDKGDLEDKDKPGGGVKVEEAGAIDKDKDTVCGEVDDHLEDSNPGGYQVPLSGFLLVCLLYRTQ